MKSYRQDLDSDWQDLVIVTLGLWLFLAPFFLQYISSNPGAAGTSFLVGSLMIGLAMTGLSIHQFWEEWINLALAVFLVASPWMLGFVTEPVVMWNIIIVGVIAAICTLWALIQGYSKGHFGKYPVTREKPA